MQIESAVKWNVILALVLGLCLPSVGHAEEAPLGGGQPNGQVIQETVPLPVAQDLAENGQPLTQEQQVAVAVMSQPPPQDPPVQEPPPGTLVIDPPPGTGSIKVKIGPNGDIFVIYYDKNGNIIGGQEPTMTPGPEEPPSEPAPAPVPMTTPGGEPILPPPPGAVTIPWGIDGIPYQYFDDDGNLHPCLPPSDPDPCDSPLVTSGSQQDDTAPMLSGGSSQESPLASDDKKTEPPQSPGPKPGIYSEEEMKKMIEEAKKNGQLIFVQISATWCGPCAVCIKKMQEMMDKYKDVAVYLVIEIGVTPEQMKEYAKKYPNTVFVGVPGDNPPKGFPADGGYPTLHYSDGIKMVPVVPAGMPSADTLKKWEEAMKQYQEEMKKKMEGAAGSPPSGPTP